MLATSLESDSNFLFHATGHFLYPLKISEKQRFSDVFRRYGKRPVAENWLISFQPSDAFYIENFAVHRDEMGYGRFPVKFLKFS